jgi:tetratricopeptide (TPR) repeat protein
MARDLQADLNMLREVLRLAQARDFQRAAAIARNALSEGFEHPLLFNVIATTLEQEGRFREAAQLLERAVTIAPQDIGTRNALALCLQRLDRPDDALVQIDILLEQHPELGFAHANKGNALVALGFLERARACHLRALELEPQNVGAMASLASIASHRGNHEEARSWAQRVLEAVPNYPDAMIALAAAELAAGELAGAETLIRQLLADARVAAIDRARVTGLLGDVLDAGGRYDEALTAYTTCNESLRQLHFGFTGGTRLITYAEQLTATVASTVDTFHAARAEAVGVDGARAEVAAPGADASRPNASDLNVSGPNLGGANVSGHVFLIGFPRSGTTLLEVVLDGHPRVASLDEHELFIESVRQLMANPRDLRALLAADETTLQRLRQAYWDRVREGQVDVSGKVFVDKYPMNTLKLPLIARLFPNAKILFACRDPREVVLACFRRRFKMNPATYEYLTLPGAAAVYDTTLKLGELMRPVFGANWREVRYESLVADFAGQTRAICDFLGLEWIEGMDDFAQRARERERSTPSTAQLARGLDRSRPVHWTHYRQALEPVLPTLAKWVERFGYA